MKSRKQKQKLYEDKYIDIPRDYNERLQWMINTYKVSDKLMDQIIIRKRNIESNIYFSDFVLILYEEPEGTPRPRARIINRQNYMSEAMSNPNFVHVYQPNAKDDFMYMQRLMGEDLINLNTLVQTPCTVSIDMFFKTPNNYSISDKFIAEYGLDWCIKKPDWDNGGKKYSDMYNSNIWLDDNLVVSGTVNKFYSILPRVEIYLKYLNVAMNPYQYKNIISRKNYSYSNRLDYIDKQGNIILGGTDNE